MPRAGPRNLRVFDATTSTLNIGWDHAEGPVMQYRITYAPMTGDPITESVSIYIDYSLRNHVNLFEIIHIQCLSETAYTIHDVL